MKTPRLEFIFLNLENRKQRIYFHYPRDYTRAAEFFGRLYGENPRGFLQHGGSGEMKLFRRIWRYFFPKPVYLMSADQWFTTYIGDPNHKLKMYKREESK